MTRRSFLHRRPKELISYRCLVCRKPWQSTFVEELCPFCGKPAQVNVTAPQPPLADRRAA